MSLRYNLVDTEQGFLFTTDSSIDYTVFFARYSIKDEENNEHVVYSFGFDRSGNFDSERFRYEHDQKIRNTIVHIIKEFFLKNDGKALLYFCYSGDEYSRHRSIIFNRWCKEEVSEEIDHIKKTATFNGEILYGGMLIMKSNPLRKLLIKAVSKLISDLGSQK